MLGMLCTCGCMCVYVCVCVCVPFVFCVYHTCQSTGSLCNVCVYRQVDTFVVELGTNEARCTLLPCWFTFPFAFSLLPVGYEFDNFFPPMEKYAGARYT